MAFYDGRKKNQQPKNPNNLTVLSWNIERGYKLNELIDALKKADADIILLQELDINCARTNNVNVPKTIADELSMNCAFIAEFEEVFYFN